MDLEDREKGSFYKHNMSSSLKLNLMGVMIALNTFLLSVVGLFVNEWRVHLDSKIAANEQHISGVASSLQSLAISIAVLQEADKRIMDIVLSNKRHLEDKTEH